MKHWIVKERAYLTLGVTACLIAVLIGLSLYSTISSRGSLLNTYFIKAKAQSQLFGQNISALFQTADLTLLSIRSILDSRTSGLKTPSSSVRDFIQSGTRFLPQISNVVLFAADGSVTLSLEEFRGSLPSFGLHRDAWLDVSVESIFGENQMARIYLSRRIENETSEFGGVLLAVVDPGFIKSRFDDYLDMDADAIALIDKDSKILTYWNKYLEADTNKIGSPVQSVPAFAELPEELLSKGGLDVGESHSHIVSSYQLPTLPFRILVAYDKNRIFNEWFQKSKQNLIALFIFTIVAIAIVILALWQIQKRRSLALKLQQYQAQLEDLVSRRTIKLENVNRQLEKEMAERLKIEEQIKTSLKEKETLLKEIHHRVKNNLAVVSSLLSLQSYKTDDARFQRLIADSQQRIQAMVLIHETLYQSDDLGAINLRNYLTDLVSSIRQSYSRAESPIAIELDIEDRAIDIKIASTLGLIVNELITNALKYAFVKNQPGRIVIQCYTEKINEKVLKISDDGIGLPQSFDWRYSSGLGLSLVKTLVENQLGGTISLEGKNGTAFAVRFGLND